MALGKRLQHAWNAFRNKDPGTELAPYGYGAEQGSSQLFPMPSGYGLMSSEPLTRRFTTAGVDKSLAVSIYDRLATDCSLVAIKHVRVNDNNGYMETIQDGLNYIFETEANVDQTGREFLKDIVLTMLDGNGVAACVPIEFGERPEEDSTSYDIRTMRVGTVTDWAPNDVKVRVYNEILGIKEDIWIPKKLCAIVINPFREIMNEPNSTLRRITQKMAMLDSIDEQTASGKIDLIIQLPYALKSEAKIDQANKRRKELEDQLKDSTYGVAYTDSTEKIIQLNRSLENNLLSQIEYLTKQLYSQLGLTEEIMNGTASESAMINYYNRTINPILNAICDEFERKFLTKTARTQRQAIRYYRDPFQLTTSEQIAEIADKFTRNAILSSNEMRSVIGFNPVADERANELRNKNLNATDGELDNPILVKDEKEEKVEEIQNEGVEA